jgi:Flp pilus assembly CpaE family ATPase
VTRAGEVVAPEQRVRLGLQRFRQEADVVILDLPPHFDDAVIAALDASDRILVVSDLGLIGGGHVRVVVRVLTTDLGISPEKVAVVASDRRGTGGVGRRDLEETLKLQVVASLPHDPAVLCAAARDWVPFVVGQRGSQVGSAIEDVARYICPELAPVEAERPSGGGRWFGRLGRR